MVGALIGALVLGTASPHLIALIGGADWRLTVAAASAASVVAGLISLGVALGPYHGVAARFDPHVVVTAWTNRRVRLAYAGYLGHSSSSTPCGRGSASPPPSPIAPS